MSKFSGLPADYDPWFVLSARVAPEGGALASAVQAQPDFPPNAARELVVLVHGFNNHMGEAGAAYQSFRNHQYPLAGVLPPSLETALADFFWPGDADWGLLDFSDAAFYPQSVHVAPEAGRRLAAFLDTMPKLLTVDFVGHSLGCRVVLECIAQMLTGPHPVIRRVVLMAAAVPDFMVAPGGTLANAAAAAQDTVVLYSTSDDVLHYTFPPGQSLAGDGEGKLPTALGRAGPPAGMAGAVEGHLVDGAGHSDYWGVEAGDVAPTSHAVHEVVAGLVASALNFGSLARPVAAARAASATTLAAYPRLAASARALPSRTVGAG